jgi:hypothetical protein
MGGESVFGRQEIVSKHGTQAEIIPRFFLQMSELAKGAFRGTGEDIDARFIAFFEKNIKDFHHLYDIKNEIQAFYSDYKNGLTSGEYFYLDQRKNENLDRSVELKLQQSVRNFYLFTKVLLKNFTLSGIITDQHFDINQLLFVKDENFEKKRITMIEGCPNPNYTYLFEIVKDFRVNWWNRIIGVRDSFEHHAYTICPYQVFMYNKQLVIKEPEINGQNFFEAVLESYSALLDFIETIMAYYYGINGMHNSKIMGFFEQENYSYTSAKRHRYVLLPNIGLNGLKPLFTSPSTTEPS